MYRYESRETLLRVDRISVTRGDRLILRDVSATIHDIVRPDVANQGQVVGVLGPSGVGKTTLFRTIAGLEAPDRGRVLIGERQEPVRAGMVGVVFQHYPLLEHRTVLGNLTVCGRDPDKARALLDRFGLADRADAWPRELSGGQRQRVAIAQQLMCGHTYLLLDEPFSGLDPLSKQAACELIVEVSRLDERNTIVIVTHDIRAAVQVADTLWLLGRDGEPGSRIVQTYNLIERELAWEPGIARTPQFAAFVRELEDRFATL